MMKSLLDTFADTIKCQFTFLENDYGFSLTQTERVNIGIRMNYNTQRVSLDVLFSIRNHEVELTLKHKNIELTLDDLYLLPGVDTSIYRSYMTFDEVKLKEVISTIVKLLKTKQVERLLKGETDTYEELLQIKIKHYSELKINDTIKHIRVKLERAWRNKEYSNIVTWLTPFEKYLSNSEKKKLHYARKILKQKI